MSFQPVNKSKALIVDLEATCSADGSISREEMEIIEIGAVLLSITENGMLLKEYQSFVKPQVFPILKPFCRKLTSISQKMIDQASPFYEVFPEFLKEMWDNDTLFASWGFYDYQQFYKDFQRNREKLELYSTITTFPFHRKDHFNIKKAYGELRRLRSPSLGTAIKKEKITFKGTPHRGIDDARNIARIFRELILPLIVK